MRTSLLVGVIILFTSCAEYQYLTLEGSNISKNNKSEFEAETDTVRVVYHFDGYKGKVGITIYNKTTEPLEINWKKSFLIINDKATSYFNAIQRVVGSAEIDTLNRSVYFFANANFNANIYVNEPEQYIPPRSFIYKVPLSLPVGFLSLPVEDVKKESLKISPEYTISYKRITFDKDKSPLVFRSYLTFTVTVNSHQNEFSMENSFYVSEVWQSDSGPDGLPDSWLNNGDKFYLEQY